ncbi:hypothetical protein HK104_005700, partial [Borealophlyctis nickersoniae]
TSWTEDEDFSLLLSAARLYDDRASTSSARNLPDLVFVITGKGALKDHYKGEIGKVEWRRVRIVTAWLEAGDYPLLLGSADLGISLHTSSSGLDLPMKVVDMFGCGLPVCAVGFQCIGELIQHGENGLIFHTAEELCEQLVSLFELFEGFPNSSATLSTLRAGTESFQKQRWESNWQDNVLPHLQK